MVRVTSKGQRACSNAISTLLAAGDTTLEPNFLILKATWQQSRAKLGARRRTGFGKEEPARDMIGEED
ncbi:hypothetical protein ACQP3J_31485, partial [Escherichia coli]